MRQFSYLEDRTALHMFSPGERKSLSNQL